MTNVNREKNAKRNIYVSLICQLITMICGLITPRLLLGAFGSEANGAATSISTFLGYIILLEGGIGGVARAALYKPLAENDEQKISEIMTEIKRFFRRVGYVFFIYVVILACTYKSISHTEVLVWWSSFLLVLIISGSTFAQYFIGISNAVLLNASQKLYVTNTVSVIGTILNTIMVAILTSYGCSLLVVKLVSSIVFALKPIALWLYVKKNYNIKSIKGRGIALKDKWTGLGQHIAFFLHSHTDVVVLTLFGDLLSVSVYSVYYMITNSVQSIVTSFSTGMEAVFGDMYAKKEMETLNRTFSMYETLISIISIIMFGSTMVLIIPFVRLYTKNITDTNYIQLLFGILLTTAALIHCLRSPYHSMVIAAGHFRQTKAAAYGEAIINIMSSIILVVKYGLVGVAIGTVLATLFRFIFYAVYLSKNIIKRNVFLCLIREMVNIGAIISIYLIGKSVTSFFLIDSFFVWICVGVLVVVCAAAITGLFNLVFYKQDCVLLKGKMLKRRL